MDLWETGRASRVVEAIWEERGKEQSLRWERLSRTWPTQQVHVCDTDGGDDGDGAKAETPVLWPPHVKS